MKNEERSIHRCLSSIVNAVDEIVVVDTGSTDGTLEIVNSFPNIKTVKFEWCDNFAEARNAGLANMESDWVIWLDADEYLVEEDIANVRLAAALFDNCAPTAILRVGIFNQIGDSIQRTYNIVRMFPLQKGLRFWGRIHEQIGSAEGSFYTKQFYIPAVRIRIMHDGYDPTIIQSKNKTERNLALLEKMKNEYPDDPTWLLFYGREMLLLKKEVDKAIELLCEAEEKSGNLEWFGAKLEIYRLLIEAYFAKGDLGNAEEACHRALVINEYFPDALFALASIQKERALRLCINAEECAMQAKACFDHYRGNTSPDNQILEWKSDLLVADLSLLYGNLPKAKTIYKEILTKRPNMDSVMNQLEYIETVREELNRVTV